MELPTSLAIGSAKLRAPCALDAPFVQALSSDPDLLETAWLGAPFRADRQQVELFLAELADSWRGIGQVAPSYFLIDQASGAVFGIVALRERGQQLLEVSYGIAPAVRNRGQASAVLSALARWADGENITLELRIPSDNLASLHVARRCGFACLGQLPNDDWHWLLAPSSLQKYCLEAPVERLRSLEAHKLS
jgi:RimJ/RimL family protein N-acetyltransferase